MKPTTPIHPAAGSHRPTPATAFARPQDEHQDEPLQWVSAMADGELQGQVDELQMAIQSARADSAAVARWRDYHLIGEALRSPRSFSLAGSPDEAFLARLRVGMAAEAQADVAAGRGVAVADVPRVVVSPAGSRTAANDAVFRWQLAAGFASVAAIGALAWSFLGTSPPSGPQLATAPVATQQSATVLVSNAPAASAAAVSAATTAATPAVVASASPAGPMLRDPQLDAFLQAHREAGGPSALHMPAGFLRNATFEGPAR